MCTGTRNYGYSKVNLLISRTSQYQIFTEKVLNELKSHYIAMNETSLNYLANSIYYIPLPLLYK